MAHDVIRMRRLLDSAGWDAGSVRHRQLEDALDGAGLKIVPTDINQFEVTSDGIIDWKAEAESLVKALKHIAALPSVTDQDTGCSDTAAQDTASAALATTPATEGSK